MGLRMPLLIHVEYFRFHFISMSRAFFLAPDRWTTVEVVQAWGIAAISPTKVMCPESCFDAILQSTSALLDRVNVFVLQ